jgi:DNA polymerase I-like protein with 3'-5' exonuclease and polymerase domains
MADDAYSQEILHGDIHSVNQEAAGLPTRDSAKTFIYAFLYGAGDEKIGSIVGGTKKDGEALKARFLSRTPALRKLRETVDKAAKRGWLKGLDGRQVHVRSQHAALNTLLQSAGAVVMKEAMVLCYEQAKSRGLEFKQVGTIHDELQYEVAEKHAEELGQICVDSIRKAGEVFNLRCPLDGEYQVGESWAQTH